MRSGCGGCSSSNMSSSALQLRSRRSGLEEQNQELEEQDQEQEEQDHEEEDPEEDLDPEADASRLEQFRRDRRRARSLPAYPQLLERVKKRVQFADTMGLSLARVRLFSTVEEPQVPSKVLTRHRSFPPQQPHFLSELCRSFSSSLDLDMDLDPDPDQDPDRLVPQFPEPRDTERRLRRLRVCLEQLTVRQLQLRGQVRVLTTRPDRVGVRYTFNDWLSHVDVQAESEGAAPPGCAGLRFSFTVEPPPLLEPGAALHFAVFLRGAEGEFWDNNEGLNYTLRYRSRASCSGFVTNAFHAT